MKKLSCFVKMYCLSVKTNLEPVGHLLPLDLFELDNGSMIHRGNSIPCTLSPVWLYDDECECMFALHAFKLYSNFISLMEPLS